MTSISSTAGTLYIVATPIGNREDVTHRALTILQSVDAILAEDTRHSLPLLTTWGINKPLISLHEHNEASKSEQLITELMQGKTFALISDAGTPLISDPGFLLVKLAHAHQISVVPIPGACALIAALSASGVACDTFTFSGFLPSKPSARCRKLESLKNINHTLVFYESTHRILDTLDDIARVFGEPCEIVLAKELTKAFERFIHGNASSIKDWLLAEPAHCKGEFVVIISPRTIQEPTHSHEQLLTVLLQELPLKQAVKLASELTECSKNDLYKLALKVKPT